MSNENATQVADKQAAALITRINSLLAKNSSLTKEARNQWEKYAKEISKGVSPDRWEEICDKLNETENSMRSLQKLGAFFQKQMSQAAESFSKWFSAGNAVTFLISKTQSAVSELRELNTLLTDIGRTNASLPASALADLADDAFGIAGRYGKKPADYLSAFQSASQAGYRDARGIAELSLALQSAGGIDAALANQVIAAADQAYQMNGSVEKLTRMFDGMNGITDRNRVTMDALAQAVAAVSSSAASFGLDAGETAAALAVMLSFTRQDSQETAQAFRDILSQIRQTSDRDPMEVLKELSAAYHGSTSAAPGSDTLLTSLSQNLPASWLDSLLGHWDDYETMLQQYADGAGSMAAEAEKTANSWEGSLNRLSGAWTETVGNIADSDAVISAVNMLTDLLSVVNSITDSLGPLGTISFGTGLFAGLKNVGEDKMYSSVFCLE